MMKKNTLFLILLSIYFWQTLSSQTVFIINKGEKYHNESCRFLNKSKIAIDLSEAKQKNYEACKICHPSQTITSTKKAETIDSRVNKETQKSTSSSQCSSSTKAGSRCKRATNSSNGKCWQHGGN